MKGQNILIISFLILWIGTYLPANAQYDISVTLSKGTGEKGKDICLTITNNNPEDIGILSYARWHDRYYASYEVGPWSYAQLIGGRTIGELTNSNTRVESNKLVISNERRKAFDNQLIPLLFIKPGESYTIEYSLFRDGSYPYEAFDPSDKPKVKKIQARVKLEYVYSTVEEKIVKGFTSNTITL